MIEGFVAVYLREILILKRKIKRQIMSMCVTPFLYLIAFKYTMGDKIIVHGHTSQVGDADYNKTLSLKRAKSVAVHLKKVKKFKLKYLTNLQF